MPHQQDTRSFIDKAAGRDADLVRREQEKRAREQAEMQRIGEFLTREQKLNQQALDEFQPGKGLSLQTPVFQQQAAKIEGRFQPSEAAFRFTQSREKNENRKNRRRTLLSGRLRGTKLTRRGVVQPLFSQDVPGSLG